MAENNAVAEVRAEMAVMQEGMTKMQSMMENMAATMEAFMAAKAPAKENVQEQGPVKEGEDIYANDPDLLEVNPPVVAKVALPVVVENKPPTPDALEDLRSQFEQLQKAVLKNNASSGYVDVKKYCLFPKAKLPFN